MAMKDLIPWNKNNRSLALRPQAMDPFDEMRHDIDRVFGNFLTDWRWPHRTSLLDRQMGSFMPDIDVKETDAQFQVTADLPGMDQKDLEVTFAEGTLSIKGEKREEHEEEKGDVYQSERRYGAFERTMRLPGEVDVNKAKATFNKGVLKIALPKTETARSNRKTIPIEG